MSQPLNDPNPIPVSVNRMRDQEGDYFQVNPPVLHVQAGATVRFSLEDDGGAALFIPPPGVVPNRVMDFLREGRLFTLDVTISETPPRDVHEFAYAIYCRALDDFARGESPPRMIIDPPEE